MQIEKARNMRMLFNEIERRDYMWGGAISIVTGLLFSYLVYFHFDIVMSGKYFWGISVIPLYILKNHLLTLDTFVYRGEYLLFVLNLAMLLFAWISYWGGCLILLLSALRKKGIGAALVSLGAIAVITFLCGYFVSTYMFWRIFGFVVV